MTTTRQELDPTGRFHGLLGLSVFGGYRVTLDLKHKRMRLQSSDEPLEGEPYWWVSGQLLVRGRTPAGSQGLFVLDTGAAATVLADAFAAKLDASPGEPAAVRALGGRVRGARVVRGVDLRFQSLGTAGRQLIAYDLSPASRLGGVEVSGLLGLDLLAGQRLVLDTANQRIVLE